MFILLDLLLSLCVCLSLKGLEMCEGASGDVDVGTVEVGEGKKKSGCSLMFNSNRYAKSNKQPFEDKAITVIDMAITVKSRERQNMNISLKNSPRFPVPPPNFSRAFRRGNQKRRLSGSHTNTAIIIDRSRLGTLRHLLRSSTQREHSARPPACTQHRETRTCEHSKSHQALKKEPWSAGSAIRSSRTRGRS